MTTLLASIIAFPILITGLLRKYFNFLILEFSTRNTVSQMDNTQLTYIKAVTKRLSPQSYKDPEILDKIDMAMFGRIPFLVANIPFNVLLNKLTQKNIIDQMSAISTAISFLKENHNDLYKAYLNHVKRVKALKKAQKANLKFKGKKTKS